MGLLFTEKDYNIVIAEMRNGKRVKSSVSAKALAEKYKTFLKKTHLDGAVCQKECKRCQVRLYVKMSKDKVEIRRKYENSSPSMLRKSDFPAVFASDDDPMAVMKEIVATYEPYGKR